MNQRWIILGVIWIASFICFLDRINLSVAMPNLIDEYNFTPEQSGLLLSAFFITYTLFQIPGGILGDKFSPKKVVTVSLIWWSFMTFITGWTRSFGQLYIVRLLFGVGEGVYPPCTMKIVSNWFSNSERATANAIWASANSFGPAFGLPIAVAIISAWGWPVLFYIFGVIGFLYIPLWVYAVKNSPEEVEVMSSNQLTSVSANHTDSGLSIIFRNKNTWLLAIAYFFFLCTFYGLLTWLPSYLAKARGISLIKMGFVAGLPFLALGMSQPFGGWISDKWLRGRRKTIIILATLSAAPALYAVISSTDDTMVIIALILAGGILGLVFGPFWALAIETSDRRYCGTLTGLLNTGGNIGGVVSPIIIGYLVGNLGYNAAFIFMIATQILCAIVISMVRAEEVKAMNEEGAQSVPIKGR